MENVLFMEDTSGFHGRSGSFLIQPSHPQRLATAMKTSILVNAISKACSSCTISIVISLSKTLVFSCKAEVLKHFVGLQRVQLMCAFQPGVAKFPFLKTDRPNHSLVIKTSLLIKTIQPDQSNPKQYAQRWFLSKNSWKKPLSLSKWLVRQWFGQPPVRTQWLCKAPLYYVSITDKNTLYVQLFGP